MKYFVILVVLFTSLIANAQSNRQLLEDIDDKLEELIFQQHLNQIDRMARENEELRRRNEEFRRKNNISSLPPTCINPDCYTYKRKYFNGACKLYWKPGYGFIEISKPMKNMAIWDIESNDKKVKLELYIDKSISTKGDTTFIGMHWYEMYQMCK